MLVVQAQVIQVAPTIILVLPAEEVQAVQAATEPPAGGVQAQLRTAMVV
jgi:hypothetical protein